MPLVILFQQQIVFFLFNFYAVILVILAVLQTLNHTKLGGTPMQPPLPQNSACDLVALHPPPPQRRHTVASPNKCYYKGVSS